MALSYGIISTHLTGSLKVRSDASNQPCLLGNAHIYFHFPACLSFPPHCVEPLASPVILSVSPLFTPTPTLSALNATSSQTGPVSGDFLLHSQVTASAFNCGKCNSTDEYGSLCPFLPNCTRFVLLFSLQQNTYILCCVSYLHSPTNQLQICGALHLLWLEPLECCAEAFKPNF